MALIWFDGFDNYTSNADVTAVQNPLLSVAAINLGYGNYGRRSTRGITMNQGNYLWWALTNTYKTFITGHAFYVDGVTLQSYNVNYPLWKFKDQTASQDQVKIYGDVDGIQVRDGSNTLLGSVYNLFTTYTWYYLETKVTIDNSSGSVVIRVNGNVVLNLTGIDTQVSANDYFNRLELWSTYNQRRVDDLYLLDTTGAKNNDFLGDVRVDSLLVSGAGSHTDFTPSAGANYENVDDDPAPDDDSTYNSSQDLADQDSYAITDLDDPPSGTTIHGVKSQITVRKDDAGTRGVKVLTRSGGSDYLSDEFDLSDSYTTPTKIYEDNPDDVAAWQDADVNGMEVGVEITS